MYLTTTTEKKKKEKPYNYYCNAEKNFHDNYMSHIKKDFSSEAKT
jgi:hypothetical protein